MREILFLSHRIPFPPDRGDKIRSHHVLQRLARLAPVHVATFADDDWDMAEEVELAAMSASYRLVRRTKPLALAGLQAMVRGLPVSLTAFHDHELADYVRELLATRQIATIYVFSGQMGQYVPADFAGRVVMDFVDVDSAKFEAYAGRTRGIMRWIDGREARLLRGEEARLARRADVSLLVSRAEADLFTGRLPDGEGDRIDVRALGNGIDSTAFDPAVVGPEPQMLDCPGPRIVFTGQMDYRPNIEAVTRIVERILPRIRQELPDATLHVVGRNPAAEIEERHGRDGVHVWGRVPDIRPWLKAADLALVPLDIARGVQNKVLEAMSMAVPVVLTPQAATGIDGVDNQHFVVAETDGALVAATVELMRNRRRAQYVGQAGRRFVTEQASWQSVLSPLAEIAGWPRRAVRNAA